MRLSCYGLFPMTVEGRDEEGIDSGDDKLTLTPGFSFGALTSGRYHEGL